MSDNKLDLPVWLTPQGEKVSCIEKIKILNENLEEIHALAQEALEDAVLMGCDERQFRQVIEKIVQKIVNPYKKDQS
ncbi:MAG TPA: hypothetical protein VJR47_11550 [Stellaceae bacterium]|nr:hypothetical protein [Stellaceae bacterium]